MAGSSGPTQFGTRLQHVGRGRLQPLRSTFGAAYVTALLGSLVSAGLTYVYVGGLVAHELNPVLGFVIESFGLVGMVGVKTAVLVLGYWAFYWVGQTAAQPVAATGFAWVASAVNVADALYDLRVASLAGVPDGVGLLVPVALVALAFVVGVVLRPPVRL